MFAESIKTNVPTELLRTLVAVCELGSIIKAAQLLQLTEPGIHQQIRKLELIIGREIIDRSLSGINLTRGGAEVLKSAQRLLSINDQIVLQCGSEGGLHAVRLGVPNLFARYMLPQFVAGIRSCAPDLQLQICCDNSPNLLRMMQLGYLDITIAYTDPKNISSARASWKEQLGWVRTADFVLHDDEPVPLISSPSVLQVDRIAAEVLKRHKRRFQIVFSAVDFGARFAAAAAGLGCMPLTRRLMPPNLVIEERALPPLGYLMVGVFVREEFGAKVARPLVDALAAAANPDTVVV